MSREYGETPQGTFWTGSFGDAYAERNAATAENVALRVGMWRRILNSIAEPPASILEVGANIGANQRALREVTDATLHAQEPNASARTALAKSGLVASEHIYDGFGDAIPIADGAVDMAFTCGVLIHVAPDRLLDAYREIHRVAARYVVTIEYFSDRDEEVTYRGQVGKLFKRDFGGVWLDHFPGLSLVDYGFFWKRATGLDNLTWWLFDKR